MERHRPRLPGVVPADTHLIVSTAPCYVRKVNILHMVTCGLKSLDAKVSKAKKLGETVSPQSQFIYTDDDGNLMHEEIEPPLPLLFGRYRCRGKIASGAFSQLFAAEDVYNKARDTVAIKVVNAQYPAVGVQEAFHLRRAHALDPHDHCRLLPLKNIFSFGQHICLVFPLLNGNLLSKLRESRLTTAQVRSIAMQMIIALRALQKLDVIHADIKPENVLIENEKEGSLHLRLADFGNAMRPQDIKAYMKTFEVQSLLYRAPEVLFGLPFGKGIDMWSLGCVLLECLLGNHPFESNTRESLVHKISITLGPIPRLPFQNGKLYNQFFSANHELLVKPTEAQVGPVALKIFYHNEISIDSITDMERYATTNTLLTRRLRVRDPMLVDFLQGLLYYDPSKRLTPEQALLHPFLNQLFPLGPLGPLSRTWTFRQRLCESIEVDSTSSVPLSHPVSNNRNQPSGFATPHKQFPNPTRSLAHEPSLVKKESPYESIRVPFGSGTPFGHLPNPAQPTAKRSVAQAGEESDSCSSSESPPSAGGESVSFSANRMYLDDDGIMMLQEAPTSQSTAPLNNQVVVSGIIAATAAQRKRKIPPTNPSFSAKTRKVDDLVESDGTRPVFDLGSAKEVE